MCDKNKAAVHNEQQLKDKTTIINDIIKILADRLGWTKKLGGQINQVYKPIVKLDGTTNKEIIFETGISMKNDDIIKIKIDNVLKDKNGYIIKIKVPKPEYSSEIFS